jgi:nitrite reductase/ring-hydroxylating ferredoxin subunit
MEHKQLVSMRDRNRQMWPHYEAAVSGFRNYWYPVTWSSRVGRKPFTVKLLGDPIMLVRENGRVTAFLDQCLHRGIPLSVGRQEFPGTWTCRYHGWTYDLESGALRAALTDGPDSPICGKVRLKIYPTAERAGLIWIWLGQGAPAVPVEEDIPQEFLAPNTVVMGRISVRKGNWRYAAENGFDDAHAKYLHRYGSLRTIFRLMPAWGTTRIVSSDDGWVSRKVEKHLFQDDYPTLGVWPRKHFWKRSGRRTGGGVSIRLPGTLRNRYGWGATHFAWYVPVDQNHHAYFQFLVKQAKGLSALWFKILYWLVRRWTNHVQFNNQDARMVELMPETMPEQFFRPDVSIAAWRKLCEHARGEAITTKDLDENLKELSGEAVTG